MAEENKLVAKVSEYQEIKQKNDMIENYSYAVDRA